MADAIQITNGTPVPLWPQGAPFLNPSLPDTVPTLTPFVLAGKPARGCVIVCPGGGYGGRAPHEGAPISEWLNRAGIHSFVLNYRHAPYRHPVPMLDVQRAVRWVRHHGPALGVDPQHLGVLGFSAGGHLASTATVHFDAGKPTAADPVDRVSCRPDAAILCYPVITSGEHGHRGSFENLLGPQPAPQLLALLSNERHVGPETPPVFLWHTADDAGVPVENSLLFAAAMSHHHRPFALHVFPHGAHGLGLAPDQPGIAVWADLAARWLHELGF